MIKKGLYGIVLLIIISCSRTIYSSLSWQYSPVLVDGNMNEWPNPLRFYDNKSKINYSITNDRNKLYVCLKISDELTQLRIMEGGMEFSIDTTDKKSYPVNVIYPQGSSASNPFDPKQHKMIIERYDVAMAKQLFLNQIKEIRLKGFKYPVTGNITSNNTFGISVSVNWDKSGIMVYEAVFPFSAFYRDELIPSDTNKIISFKFLINALPVTEEDKPTKSTQDDGSNITGRGNINATNSDGLNNSIYGTGTAGYGNNTRTNTGVITNPVYEPLEFKIKMKFSFQ